MTNPTLGTPAHLITASDAARIAARCTGCVPLRTQLDGDEETLFWCVETDNAGRCPQLVFVDACTGRVLEREM